MNMNLNLIEAASRIAEARIEEDWQDGLIKSIYATPSAEKYTPEAQELFEKYYDDAWETLEQCQVPSYQEEAIRTASSDYEAIGKRLQGEQMINMLHAAIGLATEAAEALDMLKKHIYYGKELDVVNFREEIGDTQWYAALGAEAVGANLEDIQENNIKKLKARYPDAFTSDGALNRDLETERKILEDG